MPTPAALLSRAPFEARPSLCPFEPLDLTLARVHGLTGPARRLLALAVAAVRPGPVLWIAPAWQSERLSGPELTRWIDPGRMVFVHPEREQDLLWCFEEALRTGAVPTVICELSGRPGLTPVRRLHLAAEQGMSAGAVAPLPMLLTPEESAPGVESAWSLTAQHNAPEKDLWHLSRIKARSAPPANWMLTSTPSQEGRKTLHTTAQPQPIAAE